MARRPGAIGPGYLPKGGARRALDMAEEAKGAGSVSGSVSVPAVDGVRSGARWRAGRAFSTEGLALIGAVAGGSALVAQLLQLVFG